MSVTAELHARGKVRDIYEAGDDLLMVASDRISAFDVVLPTPIPDKGRVLTALSLFWFEQTASVVPNHVISADVAEFPEPFAGDPELAGRAMLVKRARMIPIECVARGYLSGSGWKEYRSGGTVCGISLPDGLMESDRLPELTISVYEHCAAVARDLGIIIADTKFEFGFEGGELTLCDEVLTPDSSRFWPADLYEPGGAQPSFDKQYVRDWLDASGWNHEPPPPALAADVVENTAGRYREAYERLTGEPFAQYLRRMGVSGT
jgi:phosphoribosylaminoimidazole-succinocarboxamide synthase